MSCLPGCWKCHRGRSSRRTSQARGHRPSCAGCHCAVPSCAWHRNDALEAAPSSFTITLVAVTATIAVCAVWRRTGLYARNVLDL